MRKLRLSIIIGSLALFGACDGGDDDPRVTTIVVSPATTSIEVLGGTQQFSARVEDENGNEMEGQPVVWSSDDPAIASIDQNGRATALAEGEVTIAANVGNVAGTASLSVSAADCTEEISMDAGDVQVLPVNCDIFLPSGNVGDLYRVAILNQNSDEEAVLPTDATMTVTALGAITAPAASAPVAAPSTVETRPISATTRKHLRWGQLLENRTRAAHRGLRAAEAALFRALGPEAVLPSASTADDGIFRQAPDMPEVLNLRNNDGSSCTATEEPAPAVLLAANADMAVYQDQALNDDAGTEVTAAEAQRILDYYSTYGKGVIDQYFPGVPDVDGNGRIIVYISFDDPLDDGATAAYVWGGDLFDAADCAASNEADLTYFNASLVREVDEGFPQALETAVHEVKHISSFWQGIRRFEELGLEDPFQPSWLEEGSAEVAANVASRVSWEAVGGPAPNDLVTGTIIAETAFDGNDDVLPEALGIIIRMNRVQGYLASQPNGLVETPVGASEEHSVYGSGWTFLRWLGDAYGEAGSAPLADATLFATQNDESTLPGVRGLEAITGRTFDVLLEEYATALMLHQTGAPEGALAYETYDLVSSIELFCFAADNPPCDGTAPGPAGTFPWPVTTSSSGNMSAPYRNATFSGEIGAGGIRIHQFISDGAGSGIQLGITAEQPARVVVTRLR